MLLRVPVPSVRYLALCRAPLADNAVTQGHIDFLTGLIQSQAEVDEEQLTVHGGDLAHNLEVIVDGLDGAVQPLVLFLEGVDLHLHVAPYLHNPVVEPVQSLLQPAPELRDFVAAVQDLLLGGLEQG